MNRWTVTADKFLDEAQTKRLVEYLKDQRSLALAGRRNSIGLRDAGLILGILATGVRVSEACALTVGDVRPKSVTVKNGKGGKDRTIQLVGDAQGFMKTWMQDRKVLGLPDAPEAPLFVSRYNRPYTRRGVLKRVKAVFLVLGLPGGVHTLRHTNCTLLLGGGVPVSAVRDNLGHSSLSTTSLYAHSLGTLDEYRLLKCS